MPIASRPIAGRAGRRPDGLQKPYPTPTRDKKRGSRIFAMLLWAEFIYLVGPWDLFDVRTASSFGVANDLSRSIKLSLMAIGLVMIAWKWRLASQLRQYVNRYLVLFVALASLSFFWSIDPAATAARTVSFLSQVIVCFSIALDHGYQNRFQLIVRPIITAILLGSLIFGLLYPDLAIEHGEGTLKNAWHGITAQKNQLGQMASFGAIIWLHALLVRQARLGLASIGFLLSVTMLYLSRSSTALLATVFALSLLYFMLKMPATMRRYLPYLVGGFATIVIVYAIAMLKLVPGLELVLTPITSFTGKDLTFSNRSVIWDIVEEHIRRAPVLGTGYGAYWTGPFPTSASYEFLGRMYFWPSESHNGYLEVINDLGFVGLIVLICYLAVYVKQCLALMRFDRSQATLYLALFFQQLINNLTETTWMSTVASLPTTVMLAATMMLGRELMERARVIQSVRVSVPAR